MASTLPDGETQKGDLAAQRRIQDRMREQQAQQMGAALTGPRGSARLQTLTSRGNVADFSGLMRRRRQTHESQALAQRVSVRRSGSTGGLGLV